MSKQRPARQRPSASSPLRPNPEPLRVGDHTAEQSHRVTDSQTPEVTDSGSQHGTQPPKYQTLVRKEARVRADQADQLAQLRRHLTAHRADRSERLTDNTLLRVAVDLLLEHAEDLTGDTETELTESVTYRLRKSQTL